MSLFPDLPPPASPSAKPKMTPDERRAREAERLASIRLRMAIGRELDERGITDPHAIASALGMPVADATKLLTRHQWREGDLLLLEAAAAQLEMQVAGLDPWRGLSEAPGGDQKEDGGRHQPQDSADDSQPDHG